MDNANDFFFNFSTTPAADVPSTTVSTTTEEAYGSYSSSTPAADVPSTTTSSTTTTTMEPVSSTSESYGYSSSSSTPAADIPSTTEQQTYGSYGEQITTRLGKRSYYRKFAHFQNGMGKFSHKRKIWKGFYKKHEISALCQLLTNHPPLCLPPLRLPAAATAVHMESNLFLPAFNRWMRLALNPLDSSLGMMVEMVRWEGENPD